MKEQFKVKLWKNFFTAGVGLGVEEVGLGSLARVKLPYCMKRKIFFKALCLHLKVYSSEKILSKNRK